MLWKRREQRKKEMSLISSKLFILLFNPSLLSLSQNVRESCDRWHYWKSYKPGGKRPCNSFICILMLLCNVIAFQLNCQPVRTSFFSLFSFLCPLSSWRGFSVGQAVSCLHDVFEVFQESFMPLLAWSHVCNVYRFYWSPSYRLRSDVFSRPNLSC